MSSKTIYVIFDNNCELVGASETRGDAEIMIAETADDSMEPDEWVIEETKLFYTE